MVAGRLEKARPAAITGRIIPNSAAGGEGQLENPKPAVTFAFLRRVPAAVARAKVPSISLK